MIRYRIIIVSSPNIIDIIMLTPIAIFIINDIADQQSLSAALLLR